MKPGGLLTASCLLSGVLILLVKGDEMLWIGLSLLAASGVPAGIDQIRDAKKAKK